MVNVFIDKACGHELISDAYRSAAPMDLDDCQDIAFEVQGRMIKKGAEDFGIGHNLDEDAEEGLQNDAGGDAVVEKVVDIVDSFKLRASPFDKKSFKAYMANYLKRLMADVPADKLDEWKQKSRKVFEAMMNGFGEAEIFFSEGVDDLEDPTVAHPIFAYWKDSEEAPRLVFLKGGLKEVKY